MTRRRAVILGLSGAAAAAVLTVAWLYDPMSGEFPYPRCLFKWLTGFDCPGCGSARALHALTHGRPAEAWAANPATVPAVALGVLALTAEARGAGRLRRVLFSPAAVGVLVAATIVWTIVRNC